MGSQHLVRTYDTNGYIKTAFAKEYDDEWKNVLFTSIPNNLFVGFVVIVSYHDNGKLKSEVAIDLGPNASFGTERTFYKNGNLRSETDHFIHNPISIKLYHENGNLKSETEYKDIVFMVDSFEQPDLIGIPYQRVVEALLKKYGPARSSKRKITPDDEKYEIFYWLDGGWVIQVEVKLDDYTDTSKVYRLDTYYMNFPNCIAQTKYEQEEEQRKKAEELAEQEIIRKAMEEKIKNFEL